MSSPPGFFQDSKSSTHKATEQLRSTLTSGEKRLPFGRSYSAGPVLQTQHTFTPVNPGFPLDSDESASAPAPRVLPSVFLDSRPPEELYGRLLKACSGLGQLANLILFSRTHEAQSGSAIVERLGTEFPSADNLQTLTRLLESVGELLESFPKMQVKELSTDDSFDGQTQVRVNSYEPGSPGSDEGGKSAPGSPVRGRQGTPPSTFEVTIGKQIGD